MSKQVKQMEMDALKNTFKDVRDMVMMSISGLGSTADNQIRLGLRKKNIHVHVVKNSLAKRVFEGIGIKVTNAWEGPTTLAWGSGSIAELCKELDGLIKKHEKNFKVKTAVVDGQPVPFDVAIKMPTRAEAIGRILMLALSPARRVAGQILGPASRVCGQVKSLKDKPEAAPAV